jgi:long-chain fatty acid transport protein
MKSRIRSFLTVAVFLSIGATLCGEAHGQAFGVSLQANMMPASGAMGGAGIARPQDVQSTLALNPATLSQKKGTQFSFGGGWVEPTVNMDNDATIVPANITPYESRSRRPGSIVGNIGVTQDWTSKGLPVTVGMGLLTASGLGLNYRDVIASNGTTAELAVLGTAMGAGAELTDRLSVGFLGVVGSASLDGVFTGISASTPAYNLRAGLGVTYELTDATTVGAYWHTEQKFTFDDFVRFGGPGTPFQNVSLSLPNVYGIGVANSALADGRLLVAVDFTYLEWSDADFFGDFWDDQFTVQAGMQYTTCSGCKFRMGYAYAENVSRDVVAPTIGGVTPQATVDYIAALFPNANEHRISGGIGMSIMPGVEMDIFAGGMFEDTQDFGQTAVSVESYWVGFGTTWRFGRGGCGHLGVPDRW